MISVTDIMIRCNEGVHSIRPHTEVTGKSFISSTSVPLPGNLSTVTVSAHVPDDLSTASASAPSLVLKTKFVDL